MKQQIFVIFMILSSVSLMSSSQKLMSFDEYFTHEQRMLDAFTVTMNKHVEDKIITSEEYSAFFHERALTTYRDLLALIDLHVEDQLTQRARGEAIDLVSEKKMIQFVREHIILMKIGMTSVGVDYSNL